MSDKSLQYFYTGDKNILYNMVWGNQANSSSATILLLQIWKFICKMGSTVTVVPTICTHKMHWMYLENTKVLLKISKTWPGLWTIPWKINTNNMKNMIFMTQKHMAHLKPRWAWWAFIFHDLELATVNGADNSFTLLPNKQNSSATRDCRYNV